MKGEARLIIAMLIFGSIGLFVKNIQFASSEIALFRGIIGSVFLLGASLVVKQKISWTNIKRNLLLLILSGAAIGFNWIFLFEAYRYTSIANATVSYYFAPIFVMLLSPLVLKEKLTMIKVGSIFIAMLGLFLIVQNGSITNSSDQQLVGIFYGLIAASLYASVILINKFIKGLSGFETTLIQLAAASLVLLPYVLIKEDINLVSLDVQSLLFIVILGIIHTGFAYFLYFGAIHALKGQTIAVLSYIDPIFAVMISALFLQENMSLIQIFGGILILGATFMSEKIGNQQPVEVD
ncbi:EamA family transporter [Bacillus sp. DNRA2]|uniref:EamA family transporter n=1 Tax=Bacillus sp. DNRA2 TaxID=2723053 RepID=UPI00145FD086|nr:EamA family transporter [Bacillus sp. DNRA2]